MTHVLDRQRTSPLIAPHSIRQAYAATQTPAPTQYPTHAQVPLRDTAASSLIVAYWRLEIFCLMVSMLAPASLSTCLPFLTKRNVGIELTWYFCARAFACSVIEIDRARGRAGVETSEVWSDVGGWRLAATENGRRRGARHTVQATSAICHRGGLRDLCPLRYSMSHLLYVT